jgi:hypothetical protein
LQYSFARSDNRVEAPDFDPSFFNAFVKGSTSGPVLKAFSWLLPLMQSLPDSITVMMDPGLASWVKLQRVSTWLPASYLCFICTIGFLKSMEMLQI